MEITFCRLRADAQELRRRIESRRGSLARAEDAMVEAAALDSSPLAETVVDTTHLTVEQTVHAVLQVSRWPPARKPAEPVVAEPVVAEPVVAEPVLAEPVVAEPVLAEPVVAETGDRPPSSARGQIVWLYGPSGVGKSTIGFAFYLGLRRAGLTVGYVDADQVGFCADVAPNVHWVKARNLAAVWENYRAAGAQTLVAVGPVRGREDAMVYEAVLPRASFKWFRLHASPSELARRIQTRQLGGSWPQPGDALRGALPDQLQQAAARAAAQAVELERVGFGVRVDTERLSVEESASAVLRQAGIGSGT
jgi:hypothetical protein